MAEAKKVQNMFAGIARRYDFLNHTLSCHIDKAWRRRTVKACEVKSGSEVLDICAGTGDLSFAFAKKGANVVGTDFCAEMVQLAQKKRLASNNGLSRARFAVADSLNLPVASNRFDVVSVAFGIRNLEDWKKGLVEMARVAKPGGKVVILEFTQPKNWLFRKFYNLYFLKILPRVGRWVSGDSEAYTYLPESVMNFASPEEMMREMERLGLREIRCERLTGGIAALIIGHKSAENMPR